MSAVVIASAAALLGTSDDSPPLSYTSYRFERLAIDGGFAELTRDQPSATFFVTLRADDLGPDGAPSTDEAQVLVQGDVTASELDDPTLPAKLMITLSSPDTSQKILRSTDAHFEEPQQVFFSGDCENPKGGTACTARFRVDVVRADGGDNGGSLRFDWAFDATAIGRLSNSADKDKELGPFDPPWSVEISQ
ncbi:MAG TPA: hypothetical protein VHP33_31410 [Polyangiaceae bacterium]|nr:hypothetical protein [Polyangiaceae bacterium]